MRYIKWKKMGFPSNYQKLFRKIGIDKKHNKITKSILNRAIRELFPNTNPSELLIASIEASLIYHCLVNENTFRLNQLYDAGITAQLPQHFFALRDDPSTFNESALALIQYGVDGGYEEQALHQAISSNDKKKICLLREGGTLCQHCRIFNGISILGHCIKTDNMKLLVWLIEEQAVDIEYFDVVTAISHSHHAALKYFYTQSPSTVLVVLSDNDLLKRIAPAEIIVTLHKNYDVPLNIFNENKLRMAIGTPKQAYDKITEDMSKTHIQFVITRYLKTRKVSPANLLRKAPSWQHPYFLYSMSHT